MKLMMHFFFEKSATDKTKQTSVFDDGFDDAYVLTRVLKKDRTGRTNRTIWFPRMMRKRA